MNRIVKRAAAALAACALTSALLPLAVRADSSWRWVSQHRPLDVLPLLVAATLLIEIPLIHFLPRLRRFWRTAGAVALANLCSFGLPWLLRLGLYRSNAAVYPQLADFLEAIPTFTTGVANYGVTLLVELPLLWLLLRRGIGGKQRKMLLIAAFAANTATSLLCALVERSLCYGSW